MKYCTEKTSILLLIKYVKQEDLINVDSEKQTLPLLAAYPESLLAKDP